MLSLLPLLLFAQAGPATLTLDLSNPGVPVSPSLYGIMTEEINYSYDGGLYGELVRNRALKDNFRQPVHWSASSPDATIELDRTTGPSASLPFSLKVRGGAANEGYWGIPVRPSTKYRLSFWAKADAPGAVGASIESPDGSKVFARADVPSVSGNWKKYEATLVTPADGTTTKDARLVLRTGADRNTWLSLVSLFPPTYNDRPNGNRPDLMQLLVDMHPAFLRFPGGNYLEGNQFKDRFPWKETLGPLESRPGHLSPWGYRSSDGMGLLEFLEWCEDMHSKPLLAVFAGYVLDRDVLKPGLELSGFVQDALDEIEYVTGGPNTRWGAQRARDGHPKPFELQAVEIGNEDAFDATRSYPARYSQFRDAIHKQYPHLKIISTVSVEDLERGHIRHDQLPDLVDDHYYNTSWEMMRLATRYDSTPRNGPKVFVGEWASQDIPAPWADVDQKGPTSSLGSAIGDAAFLTGLERNSDVVEMSCYAPLLVNVNPGGRQWAINLVGYDALNSFGSPSYYAQKMFRENLGDRTAPFTLTDVPQQTRGADSLPALFASATRDSKSGTVFVKLVNPLPQAQTVQVNVRGAAVAPEGSEVTLTGEPSWVNTIAEPKKVAPTTSRLENLSGSFQQTLPASSITILRLSTKR